jgi:membrane protease YdiL (CAAX protease family)
VRVRVAVASGGMILFALCSHQGLPWSAIAAVGLILTAWAIAIGEEPTVVDGNSRTDALEDAGLRTWSPLMLAITLAGAGIGTGAGVWHRYGLDLPLQPPQGTQAFVVVACLIGATEELLYRGWLLGQTRALGWPAAIMASALAHAAYKTALFALPPAPVAIPLWDMMWLTLMGGLVLGALRAWSGSVMPAIVAHAAFDFVVYRGLREAPWWVWQ